MTARGRADELLQTLKLSEATGGGSDDGRCVSVAPLLVDTERENRYALQQRRHVLNADVMPSTELDLGVLLSRG